MDLNGVCAIVSGGASGLGEATARALTAAGAKVVVADLQEDKGKAVADAIGGVFVATDVSSEESVRSAVQTAVDTGAPLRVAVSCAGIAWAARTVDRTGVPHDLDVYKKIIDVNLIGTFNLIRLAAAAMGQTEPVNADGERGVLINTASVAALEGQVGQIAYAASKGGVAAMTLPAARDLAPLGIRVNTIAPGVFETPMIEMVAREQAEQIVRPIAFPKRLGKPEEYARLAVSICENGYLNGEVFRLDGGLRMQPK